MKNKSLFAIKVWVICIAAGAILVWLINITDENYREKIKNGPQAITMGEFDRTERGTDNEYFIYKYSVDGVNYTRTLANPKWYSKCNESDEYDECKKLRFLVMYLIEEPGESLICLSPTVEGLDHLPDSISFQDIPGGFEYMTDDLVISQFQ